MSDLKPGIYRHYRNGKLYRVIGVGKHSETEEDLVFYEALYDNATKFWARPLGMFTEKVEHDGKRVPRFKWVGPS